LGIFHVSPWPFFGRATKKSRNSVPFGMAPWEPSTEAGYEPEMVMCLGNHGQLGGKGSWLVKFSHDYRVMPQFVS
jgi:hypothetical protein